MNIKNKTKELLIFILLILLTVAGILNSLGWQQARVWREKANYLEVEKNKLKQNCK